MVTGTLEFITSKRSLLFLFIQSSAYQPSPWRPSGPWDDNDDDDDNDYDDDDDDEDDDDDGDDADDDFFDAQVVSLIWTLFIIRNSNRENSPNLNQIHNALMIIILLILTIVKMMTWSKYSDFGVLRIKSKYMSISLTYLSNHLINDHPFLLYQSYSIQHTERCPDFHLFSDAFNILLSKCVKF